MCFIPFLLARPVFNSLISYTVEHYNMIYYDILYYNNAIL